MAGAANLTRGPGSGRRRLIGVVLAVGLAMGLAATCDPEPGTGRIRLTGAVTGSADTGTAGCYGPGHIPGSDDYGSWHWSGEVAGQSVVVVVAEFQTFRALAVEIDGTTYGSSSEVDDEWSFTGNEGSGGSEPVPGRRSTPRPNLTWASP